MVIVVVVSAMVMLFVAIAHQDVQVNTSRQGDAVVALGFDVEGDEGHAFFEMVVVIFKHGFGDLVDEVLKF